MRKVSLLLLVGALGLSSCALTDKATLLPDDAGFNPEVVLSPRPTAPNVFVLNGYLVVDQEPIRIWQRDVGGDRRITIAWALSYKSDTSWPAADRAISFRPVPRDLRCAVRGAQRKILACSFPYESRAQYKYTLTAEELGKALPSLDPNIVSME